MRLPMTESQQHSQVSGLTKIFKKQTEDSHMIIRCLYHCLHLDHPYWFSRCNRFNGLNESGSIIGNFILASMPFHTLMGPVGLIASLHFLILGSVKCLGSEMRPMALRPPTGSISSSWSRPFNKWMRILHAVKRQLRSIASKG